MALVDIPGSPVRRPGIPEPTIFDLDLKRKYARGDETEESKKKRRSSSPSPIPFADRPLYVDDRSGGWTNETPEGRRLADFLNWSTSVDSVGRDEGFAECVGQLLVPELAEAYLKKNYPELHRETYRDDGFENLLARLERKIERIEEKNLSWSRSASKLCDAYHATFGDFEYVDDAQARRVTRLMRESTCYENLDDDDSYKKLLDEVYPEISSDDEDEDDEDEDDEDDDDEREDGEITDPEPVSAFVARHLSETDEDIVRVRDVLGALDGEHEVNYVKSFEEFMRDPFTFPA